MATVKLRHFLLTTNSQEFANMGKFAKIREILIKFESKNGQILKKITKIAKKCEKMRNLLKFRFWSGAKECKSCRSRKILKNAPTLAIVAVDTAENGPSKVRQVTNKVSRNLGSWTTVILMSGRVLFISSCRRRRLGIRM